MSRIAVTRILCDGDGCTVRRESGRPAGQLRYLLEREGWECARPDSSTSRGLVPEGATHGGAA